MATRTSNPTPTRRRAQLAAAVLAAAGIFSAAGCQRDGQRAQVIHGETFQPDGAPRPVDRFVHVQSAAAARADATLNSAHFDGAADLNSLGRAKLDLMLRDDNAASPFVVYLDLPRDRAAATGATGTMTSTDSPDPDALREVVRAYLADHGVPDDALEIRTGPNLAYSHPAKDGLRGLKNLAGTADTAQPADSAAGDPAALMAKPGGR